MAKPAASVEVSFGANIFQLNFAAIGPRNVNLRGVSPSLITAAVLTKACEQYLHMLVGKGFTNLEPAYNKAAGTAGDMNMVLLDAAEGGRQPARTGTDDGPSNVVQLFDR